jgi:hypothetical protein
MGDIFGLVYLALGIVVIWAVLKLFSIDRTLKSILAELKLQRGATSASDTQRR